MAPPKNKGDNKKSKDVGGEPGSSKTSKGGQSINVRHILCAKMSKRDEALARLTAGESFDEVARTMSEDKARQGGSLGWQTKGSLEPDFEAKAFALPVSTTKKPILDFAKTSNGYHIIMVEGKK